MGEELSLGQTLRRLLPLVPQPERRRFWFLLALTVVMALVELGITGLVALLAAVFSSLDAVFSHTPLLLLKEHCGIDFGNDARILALAVLCAIVLAIIGKNMLSMLQQWHLSLFAESIGNAARGRTLNFFLRAPYLWLQRMGTSDMLFAFSAGRELGRALLEMLQIFSNALMILTIFVGLLVAAPVPSLFFLLVLGVGGALVVKNTRRLLNRKAQAVYDTDWKAHTIQQVLVHGMKEMRLYGREPMLSAQYAARLDEQCQAKKWFQCLARFPIGCLETLGFTSLVGVLLFLIYVQNAGITTIAGLMGFMAAAAWRCLPVTNRMVESFNTVRSLLPYLNRIVQLLQQEEEMRPQLLPPFEKPVAPLPFRQSVQMAQVSFSYPNAPRAALEGLDLSIHRGEMLGVVGLSGAGKSTLVNILTGLILPQQGQLLVDGTPVTRDNAAGWLQQIGYVAQAPHILDASLADNIALSRWGESVDRQRVLECCRMAALDFVGDLEKGIDTELGERGTRLSGGQIQRVAIARALYSRPRLLIFDEATSALDLKNEKAIHKTILALKNTVTVVIIAHRLSTVQDCDSLIWLDSGRVRRSGPAAAVLAEYGKYLKEKYTTKDGTDGNEEPA